MTATERFLACSRDLWDAYLDHPFVRGIADGSLDEEKFRNNMVQDYLYLVEYARVFALGVAKARDMESMRLFAGYVGQILDGEMDIHRGYMGLFGVTREDIALRILQAHPDADRHPFYGEWVQGYATPEYHEANETLIALTERLTAGCSEDEMCRLEEIFLECSRYEMAFWDMAWEMRP